MRQSNKGKLLREAKMMKGFVFALSVTTILGGVHSALAKINEEIKEEIQVNGKGIKRSFANIKENTENSVSIKPQLGIVTKLILPPPRDLRDPKTVRKDAYHRAKQVRKEARAARKKAKREARAARIRAKMIRKGLIIDRIITIVHTPQIQKPIASQELKSDSKLTPMATIALKSKGGDVLNQKGKEDQENASNINYNNSIEKKSGFTYNPQNKYSNTKEHDEEIFFNKNKLIENPLAQERENAELDLNLQDESILYDAQFESLSSALNDLNDGIALLEFQRKVAEGELNDLDSQKKTLVNLTSDLSDLQLKLKFLAPKIQDENVFEESELELQKSRVESLQEFTKEQELRLTLLKSDLESFPLPTKSIDENPLEIQFNNHFNTLEGLKEEIASVKREAYFNHDISDLKLKEKKIENINVNSTTMQAKLEELSLKDTHELNLDNRSMLQVGSEILSASLSRIKTSLEDVRNQLTFQKEHTANPLATTNLPKNEILKVGEPPEGIGQAPLNNLHLKNENIKLTQNTLADVLQPLKTKLDKLLKSGVPLEIDTDTLKLIDMVTYHLQGELVGIGPYFTMLSTNSTHDMKEEVSNNFNFNALRSMITPYLTLKLNSNELNSNDLKSKIESIKTSTETLVTQFNELLSSLKNAPVQINLRESLPMDSTVNTRAQKEEKEEALPEVKQDTLISILKPLMATLDSLENKSNNFKPIEFQDKIKNIKTSSGYIKEWLSKIQKDYLIPTSIEKKSSVQELNLNFPPDSFEAEIHDLKSKLVPFLVAKLDPSTMNNEELKKSVVVIDAWADALKEDLKALKRLIEEPSSDLNTEDPDAELINEFVYIKSDDFGFHIIDKSDNPASKEAK